MKNLFIFPPLIARIFTNCLVLLREIHGFNFTNAVPLCGAVCLISFCACEKKELPVKPYERGDVTVSQVGMATNYKYQVWFSLDKNTIISSNARTDWDLMFEASANGFHVLLNGSNAMRVYKTNFFELNQVNDTLGLGLNEKADMPSGNLDSTAFGDWQTDNKVYVLNRGYDENGAKLGFYKIKILSQSATEYKFEYATLKSSEIKTGSITKNEEYNFIAYSLTTNSQLIIEPKKENYDVCFTQYTYLFYKPSFQYYQVAGVLTNSYKTRVAPIEKTFESITINDTVSVNFLSRRDVIGYDWKAYDFDASLYTVDKDKVFLICDSKGFYYKLHFIDFYSPLGIKGYPKFEFKKL